MKLRAKTGIIISITVVTLTAILYQVSMVTIKSGLRQIEKTVLGGYLHIEQDDAKRNVHRVLEAFDFIRSNLAVKGSDWSSWDDTYRFINDHNREYLESNVSTGTLTSLQINGMALIDRNDETIFQLMTTNGDSLSCDIAGFYRTNVNRLPASDTSILSGIISAQNMTILFASLPVLKSDRSGPPRGRLIFFKLVDSSFFKEIAKLTNLDIGWSIHPDTACALSNISTCKDTVFTISLSDSIVTGTTVLHDVNQKPLITVTIKMRRNTMMHARTILEAIKASGASTVVSLVVSIIITGAVLTLVIFLILEKVILRRLARISHTSAEIGKGGIHSERLPLTGDDEVTSLSRSINGMLESLELSHKSICKRDNEMRMLMNNVPFGILSLNEALVVNPEYSKSCTAMFGIDECSGKHIGNLLALPGNNEQLLNDLVAYLDLVRQQIVPEREAAPLNPIREFHLTARNLDAWYSTQFHSISYGTQNNPHILMITRDITEEKHLDFEIHAMHEENIQLKRITENPDFFREFMQETKNSINRSKKISDEIEPSESSLTSIGALFRNLHTIKGVAGSFGLRNLESISGRGEEILSDIMEQQALSSSEIRQIRQIIVQLETAFTDAVVLSRSFLGDIFSDEGFSVRIPVSKIDSIITTISQWNQHSGESCSCSNALQKNVTNLLSKLKALPANAALARSLRIVPALCERLDKNVTLQFTGGTTKIDHDVAQKMNIVLMHILRNALDHGIESGEIRLQKSKNEQGLISLNIDQTAPDLLSISISDDGAGLDYETIRTTASHINGLRETHVSAMSDAELAQLIFLPGFTTAPQVTEISGRGVGLDIVATIITSELGGTIEVSSVKDQGTAFLITIPC